MKDQDLSRLQPGDAVLVVIPAPRYSSFDPTYRITTIAKFTSHSPAHIVTADRQQYHLSGYGIGDNDCWLQPIGEHTPETVAAHNAAVAEAKAKRDQERADAIRERSREALAGNADNLAAGWTEVEAGVGKVYLLNGITCSGEKYLVVTQITLVKEHSFLRTDAVDVLEARADSLQKGGWVRRGRVTGRDMAELARNIIEGCW